jgi:hypothetical protein
LRQGSEPCKTSIISTTLHWTSLNPVSSTNNASINSSSAYPSESITTNTSTNTLENFENIGSESNENDTISLLLVNDSNATMTDSLEGTTNDTISRQIRSIISSDITNNQSKISLLLFTDSNATMTVSLEGTTNGTISSDRTNNQSNRSVSSVPSSSKKQPLSMKEIKERNKRSGTKLRGPRGTNFTPDGYLAFEDEYYRPKDFCISK